MLRQFRNFVRRFVRKHLTPLTSVMSFEEWLAGTKYPESRKEELRRANLKVQAMLHELTVLRDAALETGHVKGRLKKLLGVDSFIKREFYDVRDEDKVKMSRIINSRSDMYKCLIGPVIASIEKVVFKLPWFVKHVPENQRAAYITKMLGSAQPKEILGRLYPRTIYATDYTSFEASISAAIAQSCEQQLFYYMLCGENSDSRHQDLYAWLRLQLCRTTTNFSGITIEADSIRMSGEMNTSLGNGFTNLMLMMFMIFKSGDDPDSLQGVFEGDDGLTAVYTPLDMTIPTKLGFVCTLEIHEKPELASFCGRVYSPYDTSVVGDPVYYLAAAGWSTRVTNANQRTKDFLTYAKGLSYCHSFVGSPVIPHLGRMMIRSVSARINPIEFNLWYLTTTLIDAYDKQYRPLGTIVPFNPPSEHSRVVCWQKFNIHPSVQILIEDLLDNSIDWVDSPIFGVIMPKFWNKMWNLPQVSNIETLINSDVTYDDGDLMCADHYR